MSVSFSSPSTFIVLSFSSCLLRQCVFFHVCLFQDKSFTFVLKTPPASVLLLKAAGIPLYVSFPFGP
uniref:Uncharacterized protein n=1 Tax=Rhizophora mucronata TaxID=61149 RepID=A0A2P2K4Z2_RHIMU